MSESTRQRLKKPNSFEVMFDAAVAEIESLLAR